MGYQRIALLCVLFPLLLSCSTQIHEARHTEKTKSPSVTTSKDEVSESPPEAPEWLTSDMTASEIQKIAEEIATGVRAITPEIAGTLKTAEHESLAAIEIVQTELQKMKDAIRKLERTEKGYRADGRLAIEMGGAFGATPALVWKLFPNYARELAQNRHASTLRAINARAAIEGARKTFSKQNKQFQRSVAEELKNYLSGTLTAPLSTSAVHAINPAADRRLRIVKRKTIFRKLGIGGFSTLATLGAVSASSAFIQAEYTQNEIETRILEIANVEGKLKENSERWAAIHALFQLGEVQALFPQPQRAPSQEDPIASPELPEIAPTATPSKLFATGKPFKRAMLFAGGGANVPMFLAMLQAAEDEGKPIDLIVGTCGGALAASIVAMIPDATKRKDFIESDAFKQLLRDVELNQVSVSEFLSKVSGMNFGSLLGRRYPDFNSFVLVDPDDRGFTGLGLGTTFFTTPAANAPAVIILGSRQLFDDSKIGKSIPKGDKLYVESYFTDPRTAALLTDMQSWAGTLYPKSGVKKLTEVRTDLSLGDAARASVADPYLFSPHKIKRSDGFDTYMTGAINLDATNLVVSLAEESFAIYKSQWNSVIEAPALGDAFQFDAQDFRTVQMGLPVTYWIDMSQEPADLPSMTPGPTVGLNANLNRLAKIENPVPENLDAFRAMSDKRWDYGYERTLEALRESRYSKSHVRSLIEIENFSDGTKTFGEFQNFEQLALGISFVSQGLHGSRETLFVSKPSEVEMDPSAASLYCKEKLVSEKLKIGPTRAPLASVKVPYLPHWNLLRVLLSSQDVRTHLALTEADRYWVVSPQADQTFYGTIGIQPEVNIRFGSIPSQTVNPGESAKAICVGHALRK